MCLEKIGKKQSPGAKDKFKEFESNRTYTPRMKGSGEEVEITDLETGNKPYTGLDIFLLNQ